MGYDVLIVFDDNTEMVMEDVNDSGYMKDGNLLFVQKRSSRTFFPIQHVKAFGKYIDIKGRFFNE